MTSIYDVNPNELIEKAAVELAKMEGIAPPVWATFCKTGMHKERPPIRTDWWYCRCAAILRKLYKQGPIGVSKLRTLYGGKKDRGMQPEKVFRGSGSILRKALQQLEKAGLAKQVEKGIHKGRKITPKGKSFLDKIASQIYASKPKRMEAAPKPKPKAEAKKVPEVAQKKEGKIEAKKEEVKLESKIPNSRKEVSRKEGVKKEVKEAKENIVVKEKKEVKPEAKKVVEEEVKPEETKTAEETTKTKEKTEKSKEQLSGEAQKNE